MKDITIKTIGWTIFGVVFVIMFYGMFITMSVSNADIKTEHTINIISNNETKEALIKLSEMDYNNCEAKVLNNSLQYEKLIKQLEIRTSQNEYLLYEVYKHPIN